jgi:hypothetical protein
MATIDISAPLQVAPGRWQVTASLPLAGDFIQIAVTAPEAVAARALAAAHAMMAKRAERGYGAAVSGGEASPVVRMWRRVEGAAAFQDPKFRECVQRLRAELPHLLPILRLPVTVDALKHAATNPTSSAEQGRLRGAIAQAKGSGAANYATLRNAGVIVATMGLMSARHGAAQGFAFTADLKTALACVQRANAGGLAAQRYIARCFHCAELYDRTALRHACFIVAAVPVALAHPIGAEMAPAAPLMPSNGDGLEQLDELELDELETALDAEALTVGAVHRIRANSDANLLRVLRALSRRQTGYRRRAA